MSSSEAFAYPRHEPAEALAVRLSEDEKLTPEELERIRRVIDEFEKRG